MQSPSFFNTVTILGKVVGGMTTRRDGQGEVSSAEVSLADDATVVPLVVSDPILASLLATEATSEGASFLISGSLVLRDGGLVVEVASHRGHSILPVAGRTPSVVAATPVITPRPSPAAPAARPAPAAPKPSAPSGFSLGGSFGASPSTPARSGGLGSIAKAPSGSASDPSDEESPSEDAPPEKPAPPHVRPLPTREGRKTEEARKTEEKKQVGLGSIDLSAPDGHSDIPF